MSKHYALLGNLIFPRCDGNVYNLKRANFSMEKIEKKSAAVASSSLETQLTSKSFSDLIVLFKKYKKFCFDIIEKVKYSSVPSWIKFSDDKVEEVLDEELSRRTITKNIIDFYVITIINIILFLISVWFFLPFFSIFLSIFGLFFLISVKEISIVDLLLGLLYTGLIILILFLFILLLLLFSMLFRAVVLHLFAKIAGGKGKFVDTMSTLIFSHVSFIIFAIPVILLYAAFIGYIINYLLSTIHFVIYLYSLYLLYRGIKHSHNLSTKRAILVVIGEQLLIYLICFIIIIALYIAIYALPLLYKLTT